MVGDTPLRALELPVADGYSELSNSDLNWSDGGEDGIAEILAGARDLSSTSDELAAHRETWVERYHFAPERGNVVRGLDLDGAVVLEIGAGCGAVTRCLGERARVVDALEPTAARARCAALRTRDLPDVEVFCGDLDAVPAEPVYDLVVVIGVLEYVGGGGGDDARIAFLRRAAQLLRPGGAIVCAIENRLGVKYLAGAPEDHADRPFEGLEGYPHKGPHRTFARRELELIFQSAGLQTRMLHAFPDYKTPRVVFADELLASDARPLAWNLPRFPSRDSPSPRGRLAAEGPLWRGIVAADLGGECANSFIAIGSSDTTGVWPNDRLAVYWAADRAAAFLTHSTVERQGSGEILVRRSPLVRGRERHESGPLSHACNDAAFVPGPTLTDALVEADQTERGRLLREWRAHVEQLTAQDVPVPLDPQPDNLIVTPDGLRLIDDEWRYAEANLSFILERCLLSLGAALADRCPPETWEPRATIGELVAGLADAAGLATVDLDRLARRESVVQALVAGVPCEQAEQSPAAATCEAAIHSLLARPLAETQLGAREPELRIALQAAVEQQRELGAQLQRRLTETQEYVDELHAERDARLADLDALRVQLDDERARSASIEDQLRTVYASRTWRLGTAPRSVAAALRASRPRKH